MANTYARTLTSFSGADMVVYFDDKVIGEFQEIAFQQDLKTGVLNGTVTTAYFDREAFDPLKKYNVTIKFLNEYGQSAEQYLLGVEFKTFTVGYSIDMICPEMHYTFTADNFVFGESKMTEHAIPKKDALPEKIAFVKLNKDNPLGQNTREIYLKDIKDAILKGVISPSVLFD